ncbi:MAG: zinc ribbon domain-containing protein [Bacilli bacterium]|nr:zinc ribbon domain-containing protein [Bacilli bacterium]
MYNYGYRYGYRTTTNDIPDEVAVVLLIILGICILIGIVACILQIIGQWKVLSKANKPGWGAIIPIYNTYLLCQIAGINPWWILITVLSPFLGFIPILGALASFAISIYFSILLGVSVARSFGKSDGFAVGLILLPPVFYMILGLDNSKYEGAKPMNDLLFDNLNKTTSTTNTANTANTKSSGSKFCSECGNKIESGTKFCPNCGKKIK